MTFEVREFEEEDLSNVVDAFVEGFASRDKTVYRLSKYDPYLIEDIVDLFIKTGDIALVAEADGKSRGILVGDFSDTFRLKKPPSLPITKFVSRLAKISDHKTIFTLLDGFTYILQFLPYYNSGSSILLLTSQKDFRGGIGRALTDRWIEEIKKEGYGSTIVGTDERLDWQFYERYGFERNKTFILRPRLLSRPKEKINGFIYRYNAQSNKDER